MNILMVSTKADPLIEEFSAQSMAHPDASLREFYKASINLYKNSKKFQKVHKDALKKRSDITVKHYANLVYRALQYILLFEQNAKNLSDLTQKDWKKYIDSVLNSENYLQIYKDLLEKESTQTTIYQRYIGPKAAIRAVFGDTPVKVADLGCGLNLGLPGLEQGYPFQKVEDNTPETLFSELTSKPINISIGVSIDLVNPVQKKKWALACGFYPGELCNMSETDQLCDTLWNKTSVKFFEKSILDVDQFWQDQGFDLFDVAITSTVLYQLPESLQEEAISKIRSILKKGGILIVNDFVNVNGKLTWNVDWFKKDTSSYKTVVLVAEDGGFSKPYDFLDWTSGRCKSVGAGKNFSKVLDLNK
jgi:SAM-dependent methyltransferase